MAAWRHFKYWKKDTYKHYRGFVAQNAEKYAGSRLDCADLSMTLMIDFAAAQGLCLTFTDLNGIRYISKATRQHPAGLKSWGSSRDEYTKAVLDRLSAKSLLRKNTISNPRGPAPGDLILKEDHAALVYRDYPPGVSHPRADQYGEPSPAFPAAIPQFPGNERARTELNRLIYFRNRPPIYGPLRSAGEEADRDRAAKIAHIDYLNHRGEGKEGAELILFASVPEITGLGFGFFSYSSSVIDNWEDWNGEGDPPG
ncbi:MAG TPA: hypothetical protein VH639_14675 [Bryobacteraceae bacterium]|jgi:hypothetical protein